MLHVISARCAARDLRLRPGQLCVRVGDSSRRSEEIVKKILNCVFECDYYYIIIVS